MDIRRADNEWRYDPIDEAWSIVALNRRALPSIAALPSAVETRTARSRTCAFCEGAPPHAVAQRGEEGERVVSVVSPTPLLFTEHAEPDHHAFSSAGALGAHELLLPLGAEYCGRAPSEWGAEVCSSLLSLFAQRHQDLSRDFRLRSVSLAALPPASTRLPHAHATLLALPHAPRPAQPVATCPIAAEIKHAEEHGRLLAREGGLVAWVPYAPRATVHVRVATESRVAARLPIADDDITQYGAVITAVLGAVDAALGGTRQAGFSLRGVALRPAAERVAPLMADIEAPQDADAALSEALGVRISALPPEDLAALLSPLLRERLGARAEAA